MATWWGLAEDGKVIRSCDEHTPQLKLALPSYASLIPQARIKRVTSSPTTPTTRPAPVSLPARGGFVQGEIRDGREIAGFGR